MSKVQASQTATEALASVATEGWARWVRAPDEVGVARLRSAISALRRRFDPPTLWSESNLPVGDNAMVTPTGFAVPRLLTEHPELRPLVLPPSLVEAVQSLLGADARLELLGTVVTDRTRPFFPWHTHIDGTDESERFRAGAWPTIDRLRRIFTLLYLDDVDATGGPLLVLPRRVGDSCRPPHDIHEQRWPRDVELRPAAGTLIAIDECTWHAAMPMLRDGERIFVGAYFAAGDTAAAPWADASLSSVPLASLAGG